MAGAILIRGQGFGKCFACVGRFCCENRAQTTDEHNHGNGEASAMRSKASIPRCADRKSTPSLQAVAINAPVRLRLDCCRICSSDVHADECHIAGIRHEAPGCRGDLLPSLASIRSRYLLEGRRMDRMAGDERGDSSFPRTPAAEEVILGQL